MQASCERPLSERAQDFVDYQDRVYRDYDRGVIRKLPSQTLLPRWHFLTDDERAEVDAY